MKRIFDKKQLQTIMLLTAVILILLCGVLYTVSSRDAIPVSGGNGAENVRPPHELLRSARASANERIAWEINIGGSGDETPVSVLRKNNELYIFGNTTSSDCDFIGKDEGKTRGFGARLSLGGTTLAYTLFDFTVAKVIPTSAGFAAAGNEGSVAGLYTLTDSLTVTGKVSMPPAHALTACGLYVFDNRYFLVASSLDEVTGVNSLLLHVYTSGLALEREKLFTHSYSLTLLDIMPHGDGYLLAAAATFQDYGYLTVARFGLLTAPAYTDVGLGYKYVPASFAPLGSGYAAVSDRDGNCELLLLGSTFAKQKVEFLTDEPNSALKSLFYADGTYAFNGESLLSLGDDGRRLGSLPFEADYVSGYTLGGGTAYAGGASDGKVKVAMMTKNASAVIPLASVQTSSVILSASANTLIVVCDTRAATNDCGDCFGGSDVWVVKIRL